MRFTLALTSLALAGLAACGGGSDCATSPTSSSCTGPGGSSAPIAGNYTLKTADAKPLPAAFADSSLVSGTLVVTDSLALGPLRALGVGIEHVPGRAERQPELAGGTYEDFLRRRLDLILAERPKPRRTVVAPGGAPLP